MEIVVTVSGANCLAQMVSCFLFSCTLWGTGDKRNKCERFGFRVRNNIAAILIEDMIRFVWFLLRQFFAHVCICFLNVFALELTKYSYSPISLMWCYTRKISLATRGFSESECSLLSVRCFNIYKKNGMSLEMQKTGMWFIKRNL